MIKMGNAFEENHIDEEINLRLVASILLRYKRAILFGTFFLSLISWAYGNFKKPVWQGQFQIVLSKKDSPKINSARSILLDSQPGLNSILGSSNTSNKLKTEVAILKSPSVLKPVFNFVKSEKEKMGKDIRYWRFNNWKRDSLTIELKKGTSVLNIFYNDIDRKIILPAIDMISKEYQSYSGRDREKGIDQAIKFTNDQIKIYTEKSQTSFRKVQNYANKYDLNAFTSEQDNIRSRIQGGLKKYNIEERRSEAANNIRTIEEQITLLNQLDASASNSEIFINLGKSMPNSRDNDLYSALAKIEYKITLLRSKYKETDKSIQNALKQKDIITNTLKRQIIGALNAQLVNARAKLAAAERPEKVFVTYRELLRQSNLAEQTLTQLEIQYQSLALEKSRRDEPWELISEPTILDTPVGPRKLRILALGTFIGFLFSILTVLYSYRKEKIIFELEEFTQHIKYPLLYQFDLKNKDFCKEALSILSASVLKIENDDSIGIISSIDLNSEELKNMKFLFQEEFQNQVNFENDLKEIKKYSKVIIIESSGQTNIELLNLLLNKIKLLKIDIDGWIFLKP